MKDSNSIDNTNGNGDSTDSLFLKVEEGKYENGTFKLFRNRNGDETDWGGPRIGAIPDVLRTTLVVR